MPHANHHVIMKYYQHGFRKGHSRETQLIATTKDIGRDLDTKTQINDIVILDFAKTFDHVDTTPNVGKQARPI